jgi:hypothetical protein
MASMAGIAQTCENHRLAEWVAPIAITGASSPTLIRDFGNIQGCRLRRVQAINEVSARQ